MRCGAEMNNTTGGNYTCPKCGMGVNDLLYRPQNCDMPLPQGFGMQYGWVCPKCGKVLAPWMGECNCYKKNYSYETTETDPTTVNIETTITTNPNKTQPLPTEYTTSTNLNSDWNKI